MTIINDLIKVIIWMGVLALLRFFVEYWISTQKYSIYATTTGLFFFIAVVYVTYRSLKV